MWTEVRKTSRSDHTRTNRVCRRHRATSTKEIKKKRHYPIPPPTRYRGRPLRTTRSTSLSDTLSTELLDVVRAHWSGITTHVSRGPLQCRYDYRLTTLDTTVLEPSLKIMFQEQTNAFKINLSYGFVLRNKNTGQYKYYHSSWTLPGRTQSHHRQQGL